MVYITGLISIHTVRLSSVKFFVWNMLNAVKAKESGEKIRPVAEAQKELPHHASLLAIFFYS